MSDINQENLQAIGFTGSDTDMFYVLPNGDGSELHIEKETLGETWNIMFTRGNTSGVPGKDFDYVYAGIARSITQIETLIRALIL